MDWKSVVSFCRQWADQSPLGFVVSTVQEESRKISFRAPCCSFYLTVPEKIGSEEWGVWSEEDSCVSLLSADMDYLSSPNHSLTQVLEKAASCLGADVGSEDESDHGSSESEDDFDMYYGEEAEQQATPREVKSSNDYRSGFFSVIVYVTGHPVIPDPTVDQGVTADDFFTGQGTPSAVHRLLADLKGLNKSSGEFGITGRPQGDNLFVWEVELSDFPKESLLSKDLEAYAKKQNRKPIVELEMKFPKDYPMNPPFVRILRPRFKFLTGHVTVGGSICMQMLTRSGWTPSNDIESILVQIRSEIMSDPNVRLDSCPEREYTESEATSAFHRMVQKYGWNR